MVGQAMTLSQSCRAAARSAASRANRSTLLNSSTVSVDGTTNTLTGKAGLGWFWQFLGDNITDLNTGGTEQVD